MSDTKECPAWCVKCGKDKATYCARCYSSRLETESNSLDTRSDSLADQFKELKDKTRGTVIENIMGNFEKMFRISWSKDKK